jgi:hypothetical protein
MDVNRYKAGIFAVMRTRQLQQEIRYGKLSTYGRRVLDDKSGGRRTPGF